MLSNWLKLLTIFSRLTTLSLILVLVVLIARSLELFTISWFSQDLLALLILSMEFASRVFTIWIKYIAIGSATNIIIIVFLLGFLIARELALWLLFVSILTNYHHFIYIFTVLVCYIASVMPLIRRIIEWHFRECWRKLLVVHFYKRIFQLIFNLYYQPP